VFLQVFHLPSDGVASIASVCFKSRSGVAHKMHVENRRGCERRSSGTGHAWACKTQSREMYCSTDGIRSDVQALAVPISITHLPSDQQRCYRFDMPNVSGWQILIAKQILARIMICQSLDKF
jgi:hypothetical protein